MQRLSNQNLAYRSRRKPQNSDKQIKNLNNYIYFNEMTLI